MAPDPTTPRAAATRTAILDAALRLFDQQGVGAVTTNHVAAAAGISPGNLYYWFRNKDEIVRALHARYAAGFDELWSPDARTPALTTPADLGDRLQAAARWTLQHRFLARDILALVHRDPALREQYLAVRAERIALFTGLARGWRSSGVLRDVADSTLDDVVHAVWLVSETWLGFADLDCDAPDPATGARLVAAIIEPYLSPSGPGEDSPAGPTGPRAGATR
jgi:AcrR family transcriptional regulator